MRRPPARLRLALLFLVGVAAAVAEPQWQLGPEAAWVSLTVSPLVSTQPPRQLVLSWAQAQPQPGDWVGLFQSHPGNRSVDPGAALARAEPDADGPAGELLTGVAAELEAAAEGRCGAYVRAGRPIAVSCLRLRPRWMQELGSLLGPLPLRRLLLPGTHDSGAYSRYAPRQPQTRVVKYTYTQEEDVATQLQLGARYLDLRVGYYPTTTARWWLNHGVVRVRPLQDVLAQAQAFVRGPGRGETVVLDLHGFPVGFGDGLEVHLQLASWLQQQLSEELVAPPPAGWSAPLAEVGPGLLLAYNHRPLLGALPAASQTRLWPPVRQLWGDARSPAALQNYLDSELGPGGAYTTQLSAAMAELTPSTLDVLLDRPRGLRAMAAAVSGLVTTGLRDRWGPRANAVAVDFLRSVDVVRLAEYWNRERGLQWKNDSSR